VTLAGLAANFQLVTSEAPRFAEGALIRHDTPPGGRWTVGGNPHSDLVFAVLGNGTTPPPAPAGKPNLVFILAWKEGGRRRTRCFACMEEARIVAQQTAVRLTYGWQVIDEARGISTPTARRRLN
jgi:hypothetical protein